MELKILGLLLELGESEKRSMAPDHEPSMLGSFRWRIRGGAADPCLENIAKGNVGTAKKCVVIHFFTGYRLWRTLSQRQNNRAPRPVAQNMVHVKTGVAKLQRQELKDGWVVGQISPEFVKINEKA